MKNYIVLTRPREEAESFLKELGDYDKKVLIEPMLNISPVKFKEVNLNRYQGFVFTSINAVRLLHPYIRDFKKDAFVVGQQVAKEIKSYSSLNVKAVMDNSADLEAFLKNSKWKSSKPLLYACGKNITNHFNLENIKIDNFPIYEAVKNKNFSDEFLALLKADEIDAIAFFSLRTAECFIDVCGKYECTDCLRSIKALCISQRVLESVNKVEWKSVQVAGTPDRQGMLRLFKL
jgi:uroporphyrinogen-III synthase